MKDEGCHVQVRTSRKVELKVFGLTSERHGRVPARLFANKLKQFVATLEAADIIANGRFTHTYVLENMHMSEPTAVLAEIPHDQTELGASSAIPVLTEAVDLIKQHSPRVSQVKSVVERLRFLSAGAERAFGFAEVTADGDVIRIDSFLRDRVTQVERKAKHTWFNGAFYGSFDGRLNYVDLRGARPQFKLTLSAGGVEVDCVCRREDIDARGGALNQRVRIYGRAIYSGDKPLPIRVDVDRIDGVKLSPDLTRWRGAFRPFELDWDGG